MADRKLSLEPLSVPEVQGAALVDVAAAAGFDLVSMFACSPTAELAPDVAVADRKARQDMRARMAETGLGLHNLECFNLRQDTDFASFAEALACGSELGAVHATAIVWENGDRSDALTKFRRLCAMAAEHGIRINLEFFAACRTIPNLQTAADFVTDAGCPNAGLVLDMLHIVRTSGGMAGLVALDSALIGTVQFNDGLLAVENADPQAEALERGLPGTGEFPLKAFAEWLPREVVIGVEVPQSSLFGKVAPLVRAERMARSTRALLAQWDGA